MATYYWVGGSANWDATTTTNWASSSGGAGGAGVPTVADDVIFDQNSNVGTGAFTVTITGTSAAPAACKNFSTSSLDGAMTLSFNAATNYLNVAGNLTFPATNFSTTSTGGQLSFVATTGIQVVTTNGVTVNAALRFNAVGATVQLADNFTGAGGRNANLTGGTLDLNNKVLTISGTSLGESPSPTTRALAFGTSGRIEISGAGNPSLTLGGVTGFTGYTGTFDIRLTGTGSGTSTRTVSVGLNSGITESTAVDVGASKTPGISLGTVNTTYLALGGVFKDIDFTNVGGTSPGTFAGNVICYGNVTLFSSHTFTTGSSNFTWNKSTGTQTLTSNGVTLARGTGFYVKSGAGTLQLADAANISYVSHSAGTIDLNNFTLTTTGYVSSATNARTLAFGTSGAITVTSSTGFQIDTATNWTYSGTFNMTFSSTTGLVLNLGTTAPGPFLNGAYFFTVGTVSTGGMLKAQNTFTSGSLTATGYFGDVDLSGFTGTVANSIRVLYGDLKFGSGNTLTAGANVSIFSKASGTQNLTTAGKTLDFPVTLNASGGSLTLQDALTMGATRALAVAAGTFNANNFNVSAGAVSSSNTNVRTITMGSGTWSLVSTGTVWDATTATNLTVNANTSKIALTNTTTTARTFAGGGQTYYNLEIGGASGTSTLTFTGSNTFNVISSTKTVAHTIRFTSGTTTNVAGWTVTGTAGNVVTINATTTSQATLNKTGGGTVTGLDYLSISYSNATPSSTWYPGTNSINGGNNTGWMFVTSSGNFLMMFLT